MTLWSSGRQTSYPWGNETRRDLGVNVGYCNGGSATVRPGGASADDVSPWGCRDMAGNLQEWVTLDPPDPQERQAVKGGCYRSRLLQAQQSRSRGRSATSSRRGATPSRQP